MSLSASRSNLILLVFLAVVFAVMAMPLHERLTARSGGQGWLSALVITVALLILLVVPTAVSFLAAYRRAVYAVALLDQMAGEPGIENNLLDRIAQFLV